MRSDIREGTCRKQKAQGSAPSIKAAAARPTAARKISRLTAAPSAAKPDTPAEPAGRDLHEVFDIADGICVIKNGAVVGAAHIKAVTGGEAPGIIVAGRRASRGAK
jgi:hypothetical protein